MFTVVRTDLSKAFDCISHELLIVKLSQIISYLKNRTQTTKVGSSFRELLNIIYGAPQGSILAAHLFVIYICDLFFANKDVNFSSYAGDTTPIYYWYEF